MLEPRSPGAEFERRRLEDRGAEGGKVWGGGVLLPTGGEAWGGSRAPAAEKKSFLDLK